MNYLSLNTYLKNTFGEKVYKLAIDGGFSCPNRDGKLGTRGCIFCSGSGSGDFAASRLLSVTEQIETAKKRVSEKIKDGKYIAYFQAFTNTYAPVSVLRDKFHEAIQHPDVVAVSIGTRPDCLPDDVLDLLSELNRIKPVWIELGLQTIHEQTAGFIRRGYELGVYDNAVYELKKRGIYVITHVILGLPGESEEMMLETIKYVCGLSSHAAAIMACDGIKLQLLHIIKNTDLGILYEYWHKQNTYNTADVTPDNSNTIYPCDKNMNIPEELINTGLSADDIFLMRNYECFTLESYVKLIKKCISIIPDNIAIHRMTGDGDKKTLIAPLWSGDKKRVLNTINKALSDD